MKILLKESVKTNRSKEILKEGATVQDADRTVEKAVVWTVEFSDKNLSYDPNVALDSDKNKPIDVTNEFKTKFNQGFDLKLGYDDWGGLSWLKDKTKESADNSSYGKGTPLSARLLVVYKLKADGSFQACLFGQNVDDRYIYTDKSAVTANEALANMNGTQSASSRVVHQGPKVIPKDHGGSGTMNDIRDALVDGLMQTNMVDITTAHKIADYAVEHPVISGLLLYLGVPAVISLITSVGGGLVSGVGGLAGSLGNIFKGGGGSAAGGAGAAGGGFDIGSLFKLILAGGLGYFLYQYLSGGKPSLNNLLDTVGMGDTFEFGKGRNDEKFKQLQRCLIRFAGGNLVSERSGLDKDAAKYMLTVNQTAPGYEIFFGKAGQAKNPPPVVGMDDGTFGEKTATAINVLKDVINQVNNDTPKITDIHSVPVSLLGSRACTGFIDPKPLVWEQKVFDEVKAGRRTTLLTPQELGAAVAPRIIAPPAPAGVNPNIAAAVNSLTNATITLVAAQDIEKGPFTIFRKDQTYTGTISGNDISINTELAIPKPYKLSKQEFLQQIAGQNICSQLKCDESKIVNIASNNKTATFNQIIADPKNIQESKNLNKKVIKDSRIHKDYDFLSQKNARLHSALMEGLLKDIKRG